MLADNRPDKERIQCNEGDRTGAERSTTYQIEGTVDSKTVK